MSTSTLGTPVTREEAKKFASVSLRVISCLTHADCTGGGDCINGVCQCVLDCGDRIFTVPYDTYCRMDIGYISYDYGGAHRSASCSLLKMDQKCS